ncbi:MAG TPA: alpha/beta fold hydrolase [Vicinamibacterales bacterium]|nr:alpha/beta fold hydrolase [Vicinamibacterales bacterium]
MTPMLPLMLALSLSAPVQDAIVRAGGTDVATHCAGVRAPRAPLVVLESGAGNGLDVWVGVQPAIAAFARVCAYDRPTLVRNGVGPRASIAPDAVVQTLHDVLRALGEPPPYLMVGHSYGGMIVRLYDTTYPREIAGLVLVDSSHEDQIARFTAIDPSTRQRLGVNAYEALDLAAFSDALHAHRWSPAVPYVVLTRATPDAAPTGVNAAVDAAWREMQHELATRSATGRQIVASRGGHYIQRDQPELVIDAVRSVLAAAAK